MLQWIEPDWPAPPGVRAAFTLRSGGVSRDAYAGCNLALHVGDRASQVRANRRQLRAQLALPAEPAWLAQVHGTDVLEASEVEPDRTRADGSWSATAGAVCAVLVADCLPVLLCSTDGRQIAAVHAGWRGLAAGVIEQAVGRLRAAGAGELLAWLGPCIGPAHFEVGPEVLAAFAAVDRELAQAFSPGRADRHNADLQALAAWRLRAAGVSSVAACRDCTYSDRLRFFSYRRERRCGRMAALIWRED